MTDNQQASVSPAIVEHVTAERDEARRQLHQALRLLNEQAEALKLVYRENRELRKVLGVKADMQATIDQVQRLTAADFRVTIERVT